jgi:hypothetical protein
MADGCAYPKADSARETFFFVRLFFLRFVRWRPFQHYKPDTFVTEIHTLCGIFRVR